MAKYEKLEEFLLDQTAREIPMTFGEIERLIGQPLPPSARNHRPWWSNHPSNSVITKAWLDAGYKTSRVDMGAQRLVFVRDGAKRVRRPQEPPYPGPTVSLNQVYGAMRGLMSVPVDLDLTKPTGEVWAAEVE